MTPFEEALHQRIRNSGPITVEAFMRACNDHYYATRDPLGSAGDFTTAPEISQMFGEIVGAALADCWRRAGSPADAVYAELGPGRGTLAADSLRLLRRAGFAGAVHLVETSPALRRRQSKAIAGAVFHDSIADLPDVPLLLVANEFLDALPIRQFVGARERRIRLAGSRLAFDCDGEMFEQSPARSAAVECIARKLVKWGGAAIVIDYGYQYRSTGDSFQAVRDHRFAPLLENPGEQDLTAHVDFGALAAAARDCGASVSPLATQGEWLARLGIEARAAALANSNPDRSSDVAAALERLSSNSAMGRLFKVIAVHAPDWPQPAGFE